MQHSKYLFVVDAHGADLALVVFGAVAEAHLGVLVRLQLGQLLQPQLLLKKKKESKLRVSSGELVMSDTTME